MADRDVVADRIRWSLRGYDEFGFGLWAMEPIGAVRLIGDCGLTYQKVEGEKLLEIGYHILAAGRIHAHLCDYAGRCEPRTLFYTEETG